MKETHTKKVKEKRKGSTSQVFMWTDSGLQLTGHARNTSDIKKRKSDKSDVEKKARGTDSSVLSRKINFIPENKDMDKR